MSCIAAHRAKFVVGRVGIPVGCLADFVRSFPTGAQPYGHVVVKPAESSFDHQII